MRMILRRLLCVLAVALLSAPVPAFSGSPEAQAGPKKGGLRVMDEKNAVMDDENAVMEDKQRPAATQAKEPGLTTLPASEVVKLSCPGKIRYDATQLASDQAELQGWTASQVKPGDVEVSFSFSEIINVDQHSWKGASSIECRYYADLQKGHYSTVLSRKIHASGTPYRCKVRGGHAREVECRLSITP